MHDSERHRAQDTDLVGALQQGPCGRQGASRHLEPEDLDSIVVLARRSLERLASAKRSLLANSSPRFAGDQVHDTAGDSVLDGRTVEQASLMANMGRPW